jgi:lipopolysaccharide transport protein LptA
MVVGGCAGKKERPSGEERREQARRIAREKAPTATLRVTGSKFQVTDARGRLVLIARIPQANALLQPEKPSQGPLTLSRADCTLYKEGMPSLWLKAPVAKWQGGVLTSAQGARCGTVDGKLALQGKTVTWTAGNHRLSVGSARCELRQIGRPPMLAEGPTAIWQGGLLTLPSGAQARAADRSASMRADRVRWRSATNGLEATGRVHMTRGRVAGAGERLIGDTALRRFRLTGGRPHITLSEQAVPLVVSVHGAGPGALEAVGSPRARGADRSKTMIGSRSPVRLARSSGVTVLAVALLAGSPAEAARPSYQSSEMRIEADDISGDPSRYEATGNVVLTGKGGTLRADRVVVTPAPQQGTAGNSRSPIRVARAVGSVRITSQPKPDQRMEATGAEGTYWPGTQKATLTGGVKVTMTSPQLQEPAVLTGARADMDLAKRTAEVTRTQAAQVALRLRTKQATAPVRLDADRMVMDSTANRVTATGSPVLTSSEGTVRAERIWFAIDPEAQDVRQVHAEGAVRIDAQDPEQGRFQAAAREGVLNRAANTVVLTGDVQGTRTRPGDTEPEKFETDEFTYNLKTGAFRARALADRPVQATFRPKAKK